MPNISKKSQQMFDNNVKNNILNGVYFQFANIAIRRIRELLPKKKQNGLS